MLAAFFVEGFLLASADFGNHHEIARQYLTKAASRSWQPGPGPAVTVIAGPPTVTPAPPPFGSRNTAVVEISAQRLGNVSSSGQYIPAETGQHPLSQEFTLQRVHNQWVKFLQRQMRMLRRAMQKSARRIDCQ